MVLAGSRHMSVHCILQNGRNLQEVGECPVVVGFRTLSTGGEAVKIRSRVKWSAWKAPHRPGNVLGGCASALSLLPNIMLIINLHMCGIVNE
jgi:hypothetical protein